MAWREAQIGDAERAHKSANDLGAVSAPFAKFIGLEMGKEWARFDTRDEIQKPAVDQGRMKRNCAFRAAVLERTRFRVELSCTRYLPS